MITVRGRVGGMNTFEVTGPPLAEIAPGIYDFNMRDGSTMLVIVDRNDDGSLWWAPFGERGAVVDTSMDWSRIVGAVAVGYEELGRRRPEMFVDLTDGAEKIMAAGSAPVSISGRGQTP